MSGAVVDVGRFLWLNEFGFGVLAWVLNHRGLSSSWIVTVIHMYIFISL
jgi:hypothetical protein